MTRSSLEVEDFNGDGFIDLAISGVLKNSVQYRFQIYLNDGYGALIKRLDVPSLGVAEGSIASADIDGDGDADLFLTGAKSNCEFIANLYENDGNGEFSEIADTPF